MVMECHPAHWDGKNNVVRAGWHVVTIIATSLTYP